MAKTKGAGKYRSLLEKRVCEELERKGVTFWYEPYQMPYTVSVKTAKCANCGHSTALKERRYTPDVVLGNGIIIEIKGRFTGPMRTKMLAVRDCNMDQEIKMLFQADNWMTSKKLMRYSDWCDKHGFDYAIGDKVPDEWTK